MVGRTSIICPARARALDAIPSSGPPHSPRLVKNDCIVFAIVGCGVAGGHGPPMLAYAVAHEYAGGKRWQCRHGVAEVEQPAVGAPVRRISAWPKVDRPWPAGWACRRPRVDSHGAS